jgi:hypothetical protein
MKRMGLAALLLAAASPSSAGILGAGWMDLRSLPANTRPGAVAVQIDTREAVRRGYRPTLSLAINGIVLTHLPASGTEVTRLAMPLQDRLLSIRNRVEVAAAVPGCDTPACADALETVRLTSPARFTLSSPEAAPTDFSQLVTRFRAGVAVDAHGQEAQRLADLFLAEVAPQAPRTEQGPARIHVGAEPPAGLLPLIRFDLGPVGLRRSDGPQILSANDVAARTTVQVLRFGREPLVWIRPGAAVPTRMEFDSGDIAMFDAEGRDIAFSTKRDRAVEIAFPEGVDPYGGHRRTMIYRLVLLALWLVASIFLFRFFRKLPRPQRSDAAA